MSGVSRIGHMGMRVRDLDAAVEFQSAVLGLVETERRGRVSYLTCNERHHELILIESSERGYDHIGLEVPDPETLERVRAGVRNAGGEAIGEVYDGEPGIDRAALIRGPGGHVYKLFCGMRANSPPSNGDRPLKFEHVSVKARGLGASERFLADGLGLAFSDRMGRTASWWHCDADHHGMAVVFGPRPELSHYAWTVPDLNAIGRIADRLVARGRKPIWGPSRHGPGNNLFLYFHDADGAMIECCAGMARMPPEGDYEPRRWPGGLGSINKWGGTPPPRFILTGYPIRHSSPDWLGREGS
ncbi:MAG TPA: VOC family protein [Solirubrobacterales bacterium]|jgi:catechol-2,3-dioxygenase|nr:VOC family protein [Solirubrobacterales bacterium]